MDDKPQTEQSGQVVKPSEMEVLIALLQPEVIALLEERVIENLTRIIERMAQKRSDP